RSVANDDLIKGTKYKCELQELSCNTVTSATVMPRLKSALLEVEVQECVSDIGPDVFGGSSGPPNPNKRFDRKHFIHTNMSQEEDINITKSNIRRSTRNTKKNQSLPPISEVSSSNVSDLPVDKQKKKPPGANKKSVAQKASKATSGSQQRKNPPLSCTSISHSRSVTPVSSMPPQKTHNQGRRQLQRAPATTVTPTEVGDNLLSSPQSQLQSIGFEFSYWTSQNVQLPAETQDNGPPVVQSECQNNPPLPLPSIPCRRSRKEYDEDCTETSLPATKRNANGGITAQPSTDVTNEQASDDPQLSPLVHPSSNPSPTRTASPIYIPPPEGSLQSSISSLSRELGAFHMRSPSVTSQSALSPTHEAPLLMLEFTDQDVGNGATHNLEGAELFSDQHAHTGLPLVDHHDLRPPTPLFYPSHGQTNDDGHISSAEDITNTQRVHSRASSRSYATAASKSPSASNKDKQLPNVSQPNNYHEEPNDFNEEGMSTYYHEPIEISWPSIFEGPDAGFEVIDESVHIEVSDHLMSMQTLIYNSKEFEESIQPQLKKQWNESPQEVRCGFLNCWCIYNQNCREWLEENPSRDFMPSSHYFKTGCWEIEPKPTAPCSADQFTLAMPTGNDHNLHAGSIFWKDFQKATKAGFYNVSLMGSHYNRDSVQQIFQSVVEVQIGFQTAACAESPSEEDCRHYRQERSNARRIAVRAYFAIDFLLTMTQKWLSLCYVAEFADAKTLLTNLSIGGADLCSDDESESEGLIMYRKPLSWRSRKFESFLSRLRQRNLYFNGPTHMAMMRDQERESRIPPVHVPSDWVDSSWLDSLNDRS
ncbi:13683_t:CDS:2, partial [Acaulospora colombiana]